MTLLFNQRLRVRAHDERDVVFTLVEYTNAEELPGGRMHLGPLSQKIRVEYAFKAGELELLNGMGHQHRALELDALLAYMNRCIQDHKSAPAADWRKGMH